MESKAPDNWYTVLLSFESADEKSPRSKPIFEIRALLVKADTDDHAMEKAQQLATAEEHGYVNAIGDKISWKFSEILDVCCLSWITQFGEGNEVYYKYFDYDGVADLKEILHKSIPDAPRQ